MSAVVAISVGTAPEARARGTEAAAIARICARGADADLARATRAAGEAEVHAADVLPNPSLVLQHQQTVEGPRDRETIVGLGVPLGIGGRRFLRQDAAEARRAGSDAAARALLVDRAIDVQEAFAAADLDARRAAVLAEQQRAFDAVGTVLAGLSRGGEAAPLDRRRQQVQAQLHRARLEEVEAAAAASADLVRTWADLPAGPLPAASLLGTPPGARASAASPRLAALEAEAEAHHADADAAERGWIPDLDLTAGYRNVDAGGGIGHGVTLGLTVPLTLFDHGQGEAARARAAEGLARVRIADERARMARGERAATIRLARLLATADDVRAGPEGAAEVAAATRELYVAGEASLTDLFAALEAHEAAQLAWLDRLEALAAARVALMRARGALLDPALERACLAAVRGDRR